MLSFRALSLLMVVATITFYILSVRRLSELGRGVAQKHPFQPGLFAGPNYYTKAGWIFKMLAMGSMILTFLFSALHVSVE